MATLPPSPPSSDMDSSDDAMNSLSILNIHQDRDRERERECHRDPILPIQIVEDARKVLLSEASAITALADRLHSSKSTSEGYLNAVYILFRCVESGAKIIVTGVGKSGKIGQKMVASLQSLGNCSAFLDPVEAMHGDFGLISTNDVVVAFSNSGNTEELVKFLPGLKLRQIRLIAICGQSQSQLAKASNAWVDVHVENEACDFVPAPTNSTTVAMAIGDALALNLAQLRSFTRKGFAMNHPGGSLGRRLLSKVKDCMVFLRDIPMVSADSTLQYVLHENTNYYKIGAVLVVDKDRDLSKKRYHSHHKLLGIITNSDIRRALEFNEQMFSLQAKDIMSNYPYICNMEDMAIDAKEIMDEKGVSVLPVLDSNEYVKGLVTRNSLEELF